MSGILKKNKKTVVILSAFYEPFMSGAEQMAKEIVERLGKKYEMVLIAARLDKKLAKFEQRDNFNLIRVGIGHKKMDKLLYPLLAALAVRKIRPRIVHAIMESYAGGALVVIKYLYPKAVRILTLQSGDLDDPSKQNKFSIRIFWRAIHNAPNRITAISSFLAERAKRFGAENILITPNGVDLSKIPNDSKRVSKRVICVARLSWAKGLDYLVKAWPEVLKQEPAAKLVLVGEGDKRQEIENLIKELGIESLVELKGNLPHNQVLEELKKSEIFICPSLAEGLGNVFIEAQACGLPVIGTRVGGIPDIIQDMENGLLIEPKNPTAIAEAIKKLLGDKELASRLSGRALETVKRFDWDTVITQIDKLYQEA